MLHDHGVVLDGQSKAEELAKHFGIDANQVHHSYSYIAGAKEDSLKFSPTFIPATGEYAIEEPAEKTGPPDLVDGITYSRKNCTDDYELKEYEKEWKAAAKKDTVDMQLDSETLLSDFYEISGRTTAVCNNGGPCQGVTILVKGGGIQREMLTDFSLKLFPIPIGMMRECKPVPSKPGVLRSDCPDVAFDNQLNIEFDARAKVLGTDSFVIEVYPLQKDGQSSFKQEYWVSVRSDLMASLVGADLKKLRNLMRLPKKERS